MRAMLEGPTPRAIELIDEKIGQGAAFFPNPHR